MKFIKTGRLLHSYSTGLLTNYSSQKQHARANAVLTFIGDKPDGKVRTQLIEFNERQISKREELSDFDFFESLNSQNNYWLNFHGIHEPNIIERLGKTVNIERLSLTQILDTTQRPKLEEYEHYLFINVKSITRNKDGVVDAEQMSFVLGSQYLISFQEVVGDYFDDLRNKMNQNIGFIRKRKCDYLLSQLLDAILDNFFVILEQLNQEASELEKEILSSPTKQSLIKLEHLKSSALLIKKSLNPMKESLQSLTTTKPELILAESFKFYKDLSSSTTSAIEEADSLLRTIESLSTIYFASLSQNMNEVMKVLTILSAVFIPLTFIAGIYGMNFEYIPELRAANGYFYVLLVMLIIAIVMLIFFKRKKWL